MRFDKCWALFFVGQTNNERRFFFFARSQSRYSKNIRRSSTSARGAHVRQTSPPDHARAKLVLGLLLASPALAAETTSADAALQKARRDLAAKLKHQVKSPSTRATRSARATAADAPAPFAADRRSLAEEDGYLMCEMKNYAVQCGTKLTQATCAVETDCSWVAGEGCGPSEQVTNADSCRALIIGTFSLFGQIFACGFSDATNCPADMCVVYGDSCSVSDASVDDAFEDASIAELMKMSFKCSAHPYETSCAANRECKWALPEDSFADDDASDPFGYDDASDPDSRGGLVRRRDAHGGVRLADDAYDRVAAEYRAIDPATGGYSPAASAAAGVTDVGEAALLGAALAASLAALA